MEYITIQTALFSKDYETKYKEKQAGYQTPLKDIPKCEPKGPEDEPLEEPDAPEDTAEDDGLSMWMDNPGAIARTGVSVA